MVNDATEIFTGEPSTGPVRNKLRLEALTESLEVKTARSMPQFIE